MFSHTSLIIVRNKQENSLNSAYASDTDLKEIRNNFQLQYIFF